SFYFKRVAPQALHCNKDSYETSGGNPLHWLPPFGACVGFNPRLCRSEFISQRKLRIFSSGTQNCFVSGKHTPGKNPSIFLILSSRVVRRPSAYTTCPPVSNTSMPLGTDLGLNTKFR